MTFERITIDPRQMAGVPCIRGLRIPVATVVAMCADGLTTEQILKAYPDLVAEDVEEAMRFGCEQWGDDRDEPLSDAQQETLLRAWRQAQAGEGRRADDVLDDLGHK